MRYLSIAAVALSLLGVGQADICRPDGIIVANNDPSSIDERSAAPAWLQDRAVDENTCQIQIGSDADNVLEKRLTTTAVQATITQLTIGNTYKVQFSYFVKTLKPSCSSQHRKLGEGLWHLQDYY
ncbi:hypothetical protein G7Z17_g4733 [Cylindrodendrum hubeiense]|uniref:Cystatin domain-containing protein n=1 Tax=Cylindrodendrum hubeiense TaxID=595255 RepID=A0A9P5LI27_9HYPO|nr:hypothetical protein G7Z17_g4733 [Cylindrodendrum hubeiense]